MRRAPSRYQALHRELEAAFARASPRFAGLVLSRRDFRTAPPPGWSGADDPDGAHLLGPLDGEALLPENDAFPIWVVAPPGDEAHRRAVVLLHGLNERRWTKYLPWAHALASELGRPVILFPMALHMERAPARWSDPREMRRVSLLRQRALPDLAESSYANAALSVRLHARPTRLVWSGHRTLVDLLAWVRHVDEGGEPRLARGARLDFFGYSIGALLAELLLMGDDEGRFAASRVFGFCGGCLLGESSPRSKEILDSAAARAIHRLFLEEWDWQKELQPTLARVLEEDARGRAFERMLREDRFASERADLLSRIGDRVAAVALAQDQVIPALAVERTLGPSGARVETLDFPYPYDHVRPFSLRASDAAEADRAFEAIFGRAARWLDAA